MLPIFFCCCWNLISHLNWKFNNSSRHNEACVILIATVNKVDLVTLHIKYQYFMIKDSYYTVVKKPTFFFFIFLLQNKSSRSLKLLENVFVSFELLKITIYLNETFFKTIFTKFQSKFILLCDLWCVRPKTSFGHLFQTIWEMKAFQVKRGGIFFLSFVPEQKL
jgi:hypothetical protein